MSCDSENHPKNRCCRGLKSFIQPRVLLKIAQKPMHGYELLECLGGLPHPGTPDTGSLYRLLRGMEDEGLLVSGWDAGESGPARRMYTITDQGLENLRGWMGTLRETHAWLEGFFLEFESFEQQILNEEKNSQ